MQGGRFQGGLSTDLMPADILTKLLGAAKVKDMCRLLGLGQ